MLKFHIVKETKVAELTDTGIRISKVQEVLDLMGDSGSKDCNMIIIHKQNLHEDFFRLHTGLAGEILQKFSTYDFRLAIVGDFSRYRSKSLQDFIRESNRGNRIFFTGTLNEAILKLIKN